LIATLITFFTTDLLLSLGIRRYLMKKDPLLICVIAGYLYNAFTGALYIYITEYKELPLAFDVSELYTMLLPGSLFFCFFMFFFHCWAFASGLKTYPGKYKDLE